jgi:serine/threonine-protein kinase
MAGPELDSTLDSSFPTYAELTQTQAWNTLPARRITGSLAGAALAADQASGARYAEGAVLGVGGMGKVVLAHDARIGREVALKQLHPEHELGADDRARFLREAQVQGQLEHPSIVPVYDIDHRPDGTTFFTMRRVLGRTLHALLDDARAPVADGAPRPTTRELLTAFATVCLTVDYAHSRGVVHRDLKPANIMLGDFGEVYVLDWGLARLVDATAAIADAAKPAARLSVPGEMLGTPLYMAPEQMGHPDVGPAADVFALGAILFEILTLERVRDPRQLFSPVDARPSVRAPEREVAPELETICVRATQLDPADRYPSARALHDALARYLAGDRELAQRKAAAADHAAAARAALARSDAAATDAERERERTAAMRELARALALDPTDAEQIALLSQILATPPKVMPDAVRDELRAENDRTIRSGMRHSVIAMVTWFLFLPGLVAMGITSAATFAVIAVPAIAALVLSAIAARQRVIGRAVQLGIVTCTMLSAMAISRVYGPLILVPTIVATYAVVMQAHPGRAFRRFALVAAPIALVVPVALELAGVLPASYRFVDGTWVVVPQLIGLPAAGTIALLVVANIAAVIVPALFISRLRADLSGAQARFVLQTWHVSRLGVELGARPGAA